MQENQVDFGEPKAFVIKSSHGIAEAVRSEVTLREERQEFCYVKGRPTITSAGYNKLNQVSAISILSPLNIGNDPK